MPPPSIIQETKNSSEPNTWSEPSNSSEQGADSMISLGAYYFVLAALGAERIVEVIISARNARWAFARGATESGAGHYPAMVAFHTLFIVSCALEARNFPSPFP